MKKRVSYVFLVILTGWYLAGDLRAVEPAGEYAFKSEVSKLAYEVTLRSVDAAVVAAKEHKDSDHASSLRLFAQFLRYNTDARKDFEDYLTKHFDCRSDNTPSCLSSEVLSTFFQQTGASMNGQVAATSDAGDHQIVGLSELTSHRSAAFLQGVQASLSFREIDDVLSDPRVSRPPFPWCLLIKSCD